MLLRRLRLKVLFRGQTFGSENTAYGGGVNAHDLRDGLAGEALPTQPDDVLAGRIGQLGRTPFGSGRAASYLSGGPQSCRRGLRSCFTAAWPLRATWPSLKFSLLRRCLRSSCACLRAPQWTHRATPRGWSRGRLGYGSSRPAGSGSLLLWFTARHHKQIWPVFYVPKHLKAFDD